MRAESCRADRSPQLKPDFLDIEDRWLSLAKSYELSERLDDFSGANRRTINSVTPKKTEP